ncbi:MAG: hypothetical protein K1X82_01525 [Bacteroidia bacterium]|nr:hypothetical protein [Bacteroidia bacterium]
MSLNFDFEKVGIVNFLMDEDLMMDLVNFIGVLAWFLAYRIVKGWSL